MRLHVISGVVVWLTCSAWVASAQQTAVPLYGRFETQFTNDKAYTNPFKDVVLEATFSAPSGRKIAFFGFYDGDGNGGQSGNVWKLRFMPDELGQWSFACRFSDGARGMKGRFVCVQENARPGPLHVDGTRFVYPDKRTFQPRSYYYSEAFCGDWTAVSEGIKTFFRTKDGFNWCCTTFWQGRLLKSHKWNALPFNGFYPIRCGDYTVLDLKTWRHVDEALNELEKRGVVWFNFDGFVPNVGGTMSNKQRLDFDAQKIYVRNAVARLAPYWNVTWNIAFEWHEFMKAEQVAQLADYVHAIDPWKHPVTVHDQGKFTSGQEVKKNLHVDFVTLQYDAGRCGDALKAAAFVRPFTGTCPVYAQEVMWEGPDKLDGDGVRRGAWGVAMAGGIVNYAEQFDRVYGNGEGFRYVRVLLDLIDLLPWDRMKPRNDLVGLGQLCFALEGEAYVVYAPSGGPVMVDLTKAKGHFKAVRLNAKTGQSKVLGEVTGGGKRLFTFHEGAESCFYLVHEAARSQKSR
jgi:Domain of unknown function (DUF5060)/Protein of unknown function (DUF4038)